MLKRSEGALVWLVAAGFAAALPMACGEAFTSEQTLSRAEYALDSGPHQTYDGGSFDTDHDWGDMNPVDQPGYTGINWPADQGLIGSEQNATAALDGGGCIFGAHGNNPADHGGHTGAQAIPGDTDQSICHSEYHPECVGRPLVLSVCYAGAAGTGGYIPIAAVMSQRCGTPPDQVVACTGRVFPGVPMLCEGTIVDGNGNPIGPQTIGGLNIRTTDAGRGAPPGYQSRCPGCGDGTCGSGESCGSCSSDCGSCPVDAGPPAPYCGDGTCGSGESCGSCSSDCGYCMYDGGMW